MTVHEWRDETDDGQVRLVRATRRGKAWRLEVRLKSEPAFVELDPPPVALLRDLRDVLARKYRRGRVAYEDLTQLDEILGDDGGGG